MSLTVKTESCVPFLMILASSSSNHNHPSSPSSAFSHVFRHLSSAIQPASLWEAKMLAWQDPLPVGVVTVHQRAASPWTAYCATSQRLLHPVLQTCSSFSFSAVCQESAHANRQGCGQIKAYGKVVFIWISNVFPSWCVDPAASPLLANPCLLCPV